MRKGRTTDARQLSPHNSICNDHQHPVGACSGLHDLDGFTFRSIQKLKLESDVERGGSCEQEIWRCERQGKDLIATELLKECVQFQ
jgi:hypothetical protein